MAASTEKTALNLLRAIKKEAEAEPDIMKRRSVGAVAEKVCSSQKEFELAFSYLAKNLLIESWNTDGELRSEPSLQGLQWIESHKEKWTRAERFTAYGLIVTVALAAIALLYQLIQP